MVRTLISTARRLALKIASYGVMHLVVAILVAFAITRDWRLALAVGVVEPFFQNIAYSIHDGICSRIGAKRAGRAADLASAGPPLALVERHKEDLGAVLAAGLRLHVFH